MDNTPDQLADEFTQLVVHQAANKSPAPVTLNPVDVLLYYCGSLIIGALEVQLRNDLHSEKLLSTARLDILVECNPALRTDNLVITVNGNTPCIDIIGYAIVSESTNIVHAKLYDEELGCCSAVVFYNLMRTLMDSEALRHQLQHRLSTELNRLPRIYVYGTPRSQWLQYEQQRTASLIYMF